MSDMNEQERQRQWAEFQEFQKQQNKKGKKKWLWGCGGCLILLIIGIIILFAVANAFFKGFDEELNGTKEEQQQRKDNTKKVFKVGDSIKGDGVTYTLDSVEYADTSSEDASAPENGIALKVNVSFKNENDQQVLVDNADFSMKVNGKNFEEWYGSGDTNGTFTHQLNEDNTATGYIYYDVPDADSYTLELNAVPDLNQVKGKWKIQKTDIK